MTSYDLQRFVDAQNDGRVYDQAIDELRRGRKQSHWMWFVFPQLAGLGLSPMSRHFAISGIDEARDYLAHPILGPRLRACAEVVAATTDRSAEDVFGAIDAIKLRSSMTLFALAAPDEAVFRDVLDRHFDGAADPRTTELLATGE